MNKLLRLFLIISFAVNLYSTTRGWYNPISDSHEFRQTQTAISAYYMIKNGIQIDYITPIFGAPWSIPMEFPTYQILVALITIIFHYPLEQSGRLISVFFFYAVVITVYSIIKKITKNTLTAQLVSILLLLSPIYLFWSRTFMIESTALFFSVFYIWSLIKAKENWRYFLLAALSATLAGLTKITTLLIFFPLIFYFITTKINKKTKLNEGIPFIIKIGISAIVAVVISYAWINHADGLKQQNPIASTKITSSALKKWNFGSIEQRLSPEIWKTILLSTQLFPWKSNPIPIFTAVALMATLFTRKYRKLILICIVSYLTAPIVFTNLYFQHDYYGYANNIFLLVAIGLVISEQIRSKTIITKSIGAFCLIGLSLWMIHQYRINYFYLQTHPNKTESMKVGELIKQNTSPSDILLVYGFNWSPALAYYSERKAIMDDKNTLESENIITLSLNKTVSENVRVIIVNDVTSNKHEPSKKVLSQYNISNETKKTISNTMVSFPESR